MCTGVSSKMVSSSQPSCAKKKVLRTMDYTEFFAEMQVFRFARHRNIVGLLGYCCEETHNILVYEYICNNSLEWHLFGVLFS
jgi:interleukin-1 receptor-associated kinase 1